MLVLKGVHPWKLTWLLKKKWFWKRLSFQLFGDLLVSGVQPLVFGSEIHVATFEQRPPFVKGRYLPKTCGNIPWIQSILSRWLESSFKTSYPLWEQSHLWWQSQVSIIFHQSNQHPIDPMLEMRSTLPGNPSWHAAKHPWNSKAFRIMWVGSNLGSLQWGFKHQWQWLLNSVQTIMLIIFLSFWNCGGAARQVKFCFSFEHWPDIGYGHSFELVDTNQKPLCKIVTTRMILYEFSLCVFPAHCHITNVCRDDLHRLLVGWGTSDSVLLWSKPATTIFKIQTVISRLNPRFFMYGFPRFSVGPLKRGRVIDVRPGKALLQNWLLSSFDAQEVQFWSRLNLAKAHSKVKLSFHAVSPPVQRERTGSANWSWPAWGQTWY